jgi:hypothetical protein
MALTLKVKFITILCLKFSTCHRVTEFQWAWNEGMLHSWFISCPQDGYVFFISVNLLIQRHFFSQCDSPIGSAALHIKHSLSHTECFLWLQKIGETWAKFLSLNKQVHSSSKYVYFLNAFFTSLYISFALMFLYWRYKFVIAEMIRLYTSS